MCNLLATNGHLFWRECAHLADGLISCPFLSHLMGALGSATSTVSWIFLPLSTEYAGSNFFRKAGERQPIRTLPQATALAPPPPMSRLLTVTLLGLHLLHLLQPLQHAPQVGDAVLEGDALVVAGLGRLQDLPHVHVLLHLRLFLLPGEQVGSDTTRLRSRTRSGDGL